MLRLLSAHLEDPKTAATLVPVLIDIGFEWAAPKTPAREIETIVAYSFGNRLSGNLGRPQPGPVNEALAEAVAKLQKQSGATRVFAQWEIAEVLQVRYPKLKVVSIEPVKDKDGKETYLSTDGVAEAVAHNIKSPPENPIKEVIGVVAHRDHAKRCVQTSKAKGMQAFVAKELELPMIYDSQSGQPWTRHRDVYLLHDMAAQMMRYGMDLSDTENRT